MCVLFFFTTFDRYTTVPLTLVQAWYILVVNLPKIHLLESMVLIVLR